MMRQSLAVAMSVVLAGLPGWLEPWVPAFTPTEWADVDAVEWHAPEPQETGATIDEPLHPLDPATANGFVPSRIVNGSLGLNARFLMTPASGDHNSVTLDLVRSLIGDAEKATDKQYSPEAQDTTAGLSDRGCVEGSTFSPLGEVLRDPALAPAKHEGVSMSCDVMAAASTLLVQRIRLINTLGEKPVDRVVTVITDTSRATTVPAKHLWNDEGPRIVWQAITETLRHEARGLSLMPPQSEPDEALIEAILDSAVPLTDGALHLTIPQGFQTPELEALGVEPLAEARTLKLTPEVATTALSETGQSIMAAINSEDPLLAPDAVLPGKRDIDCSLFACVALTYDDGPSALTPTILDALRDHGASASFFMVGSRVESYAAAAKRVVTDGHLALNHSWSHLDLSKLAAGTIDANGDATDPGDLPSEEDRKKAVDRELSRTSKAIAAATGVAPTAFRPPYGAYDDAVLKIAKMPAILWDVDTEDWKGVAGDDLVSSIVPVARPGSIVLQHDIHDSSAATIEQVLDGLENRGFMVVNVGQLLGGMPASGAYSSSR